jgi:hypothetical protein
MGKRLTDAEVNKYAFYTIARLRARYCCAYELCNYFFHGSPAD